MIAREQGSDAASLAFEALTAAKADGADVLIVDTAGRLQNKTELMGELEKIVRVMKKVEPAAPHAVLLVLDATVGQNALSQAAEFTRIAGVTGLVMTKLDGTARGGILVAIAAKHKLPVHFIGVGEGVDDLAPFAAKDFANAIAGIEARCSQTEAARTQSPPQARARDGAADPVLLRQFAAALFLPLVGPLLPEAVGRREGRHLRRDRGVHGGDPGRARGVLCADAPSADHAAGDGGGRAGVRRR